MKIKGAIFDLDGTILESSHVWGQIDVEFLGRRGFSVPDDYVETISPMGFEKAAEYTIRRFGFSSTKEEIMDEWNQMAREAYATEVCLKPGTKELLQYFKDRGVKMGVATSNNAYLYEPCLKRNGIYEYFQAFTEVTEVERGKAFPDIYLETAKRLSVQPEECVVLEDLASALKGAGSGGFITIGVIDDAWKKGQHDMQLYCDHVVAHLIEVTKLFN